MIRAPASDLLSKSIELHRAGRFKEAANGYEKLLKQTPRDPRLLDLLGMAKTSIGQVQEGRRLIEQAIRLSPGTASFHHDLALTYKREGDFDRSHRCLDQAIRLDPAREAFVVAKAELHFMAGEYGPCVETIAPLVSRPAVTPAAATLFGKVAPRVKRQREAVEAMNRCLGRSDLAPYHRASLLFTLGAAHDSMDEYDLAFDAFRRGNEVVGRRFDRNLFRAWIDAMVSGWTSAAIGRLPRTALDGSRLLFIVGMPRSGSTLVEQVLGASDSIFPAGELNALPPLARSIQGGPVVGLAMVTDLAKVTSQALLNAGRSYLGTVQALRPGARTVVDKMLFNFLHLGLIQQMFPGARVIHTRRDPMDTCLSCYFQYFDGNIPFAYDLEDLGFVFRQYERLMDHWRRVLTLPVLDLQYEEMVADPEGTARRLYEFAGLEWTDAALRFHESRRTALTSSNAQVRQPIYNRSVQRWRHYEKHLEPLKRALAG